MGILNSCDSWSCGLQPSDPRRGTVKDAYPDHGIQVNHLLALHRNLWSIFSQRATAELIERDANLRLSAENIN